MGHRAFAPYPDLRNRFFPAGPFSSLPVKFSKGFVSPCLSLGPDFQFRDSFFNSCPYSRNTVCRSCFTGPHNLIPSCVHRSPNNPKLSGGKLPTRPPGFRRTRASACAPGGAWRSTAASRRPASRSVEIVSRVAARGCGGRSSPRF